MNQAKIIPTSQALADAATSQAVMRAVAQGVSALAALILLAAVVVLLQKRRGRPSAAWMAAALFLFLVLLSHLLLFAGAWQPQSHFQSALGLAAAVGFLGAATILLVKLPRLIARGPPRQSPSSEAAPTGSDRQPEEVRRFELALSSSNITVFAQDADLRYISLHNPRSGLTPGVAGDSSAGTDPPEALALKQAALTTGLTQTGRVTVALAGTVRHFDLTVTPTRNPAGVIDGLLGTAIDVTGRRRLEVRLATMAAQAAEAYRRFDLALEDSPITVFEQDAELRYTFMHNPPPGSTPEAYVGRSDGEIYDDRDARRLSDLKRRVIDTGERVTTELDLGIDGTSRFFSLRLDPRSGDSGEIEGLIGTAVDLTERRRHEENMKLVMRELTHRSKNLLAVVQAMARKTASAAPDTDSFIRDFSSRLRAIAAAHDLLVAESWSGANLRDLLAVTLSQSVDLPAPAVDMQGSDLKLAPDAAQMLGLAFHELTMNAVEHGALSIPDGRVRVRWEHDGDRVRLSWRETGGPAVAPPGRSGFGRTLLERLVGASLGGSVTLDFPADGFVCILTFPEDRLIAA